VVYSPEDGHPVPVLTGLSVE